MTSTIDAPVPAPAVPDATTAVRHPVAEARPVRLRLLVLLAFVAAATPLSVDLYLASFPAIQRGLATTPGMVQLTLTSFLVGIAIGQPVWGPLSDRFGRRTTLIGSNLVTVASSFLVVLAPTIEVLIAARFVQALSVAAGIVIARAMIADLAQGYAGVRALAVMMTIHGLTPVLSPALGGLLATFVPWRGVLAVLAVVVTLQLLATALFLPETLPPARRAARVDFRDLVRVLARPAYFVHALTLGFAVASTMAYVSSSSFVFQKVLGFSPLTYGVLFTINALGMTVGGLLSAQLARKHVHPRRTVAVALPGVVTCCLLVLGAALSPWPVLLVAPLFANAFFANLVISNCMGLVMQHSSGMPGAGSAMLGLFMFGISAVVTPIPGLLGGVDSAVPMAVLMTVMALCASGSFVLGHRWLVRHRGSETAFA